MKKLLGISIVAVLAVTPLMANASPVSVDLQGTNGVVTASNDVASTSYVKGAYNVLGTAINSLGTTVGDSTNGLVKRVADLESGSQAKLTEGDGININTTTNTISVDAGTGLGINATSGALELSAATQTSLGKADNAADKDLSNLSNTGKGVITTEVTKNAASGTYSSTGTYANDTIGKALQGKQDIIPDLIEIRSGAAAGATALQKADVTTGTEQMANGTISVDGTAVAVKGLKSAAFAETTDFDAAGTATTAKNAVETKLESGAANGYAINAKSLQVQGTDVLTTGSSLDGAKITDASVAKAALASSVQSSLDKADSAVQSVAEGATNGTIKVDGTDVAVHGLGSAAYTSADAYDAAGAAGNALNAAKAWTDQKLVTVHTTWGSDNTTGTVALANTPTQP